jgi:hypothetical protein
MNQIPDSMDRIGEMVADQMFLFVNPFRSKGKQLRIEIEGMGPETLVIRESTRDTLQRLLDGILSANGTDVEIRISRDPGTSALLLSTTMDSQDENINAVAEGIRTYVEALHVKGTVDLEGLQIRICLPNAFRQT